MGKPEYDVYVSRNRADEGWVSKWLLSSLEEACLRVAPKRISLTLPPIKNIELGIDRSHRTLVVLTPDWVANELNNFEGLLATSEDPAARKGKLIPLLLKECDVPKEIAFREKANFTDEAHWEKECKDLVDDLVKNVIPAPFPGLKPDGKDDNAQPNLRDYLNQWKRWLRRYRQRIFWGTALTLIVMVVLFTALGIPPFHPRLVWQAESFRAPGSTILHNTGAVLIIGGRNAQEDGSCVQPNKGLWYRSLIPGSQWQASQIEAELLCIKDWGGPGMDALSDIVALASLPEAPETVYALTSHSGLLVSADAGARFTRHPASDKIEDLVVARVPPATPFSVSGNPSSPIFWVINQKGNLLVYRHNEWIRLDGGGEKGCAGLPELLISSLLVTDDALLIGSAGVSKQGLWVSYDEGRTCQQVFDVGPNPRYDFFRLWEVGSNHPRYLALVHDGHVEPRSDLGAWQLLDLCPHSDSCSETAWQSEARPIWYNPTLLKPPVDGALVQKNSTGDAYEWYLITEAGQVWRGDLQGNVPEDLPDIRRCYNLFSICNLNLAPTDPGEMPYLLAAQRVYQYGEGLWWRRYWP